MIFYIILTIVIISIYFYIKQLIDYRYKGTFPIQIKIIEIRKLVFSSIIFNLFGYIVYEIQGEGEKRRYHITVIVKSNRKFKNGDEIKILKIDKNNYLGEQI